MTPELWNSLPKKIMAAGAIFLDGNSRVLLVKPTYHDWWHLPGGVVEPGESPRRACMREIREELGHPFQVGRPLLIDYTRESDGLLVDHFEWIFQGTVFDELDVKQIVVDGKEIADFRFVSVAHLGEMVETFNVRRINNALDAMRDGVLTHTDDQEAKSSEKHPEGR